MAISIPALVDTQLAALRASMEPVQNATTNTASFAAAPGALGNRCADILTLLTGLVDSGTLTGVGIHAAADATNTIAVAADATDQSTANTLLNALRDGTGEAGGGVAAHYIIVGSSEHIGADVTNAIAAAAATDLATSITLVNELKADTNAHMLLNAATGHYGPDLANQITSPDATDLASVIVLANEIKAKFNAHCANVSAGSLRHVVDNAAFTTVNSLVGSTITFAAATTTTALQGATATIVANGVNHLVLDADLPAIPAIGDTLTLAYSLVDTDIAVLNGSRSLGASQSHPYGAGPSFVNAVLKILQSLGVTPPAWLNTASAEPFGLGSPHAGAGGTHGHAALILASNMLQEVRDAIAAYTAPA